jgi:MarR family 2-MHQ and catechol resistance regulon transcriptional repressor
MQPIVWIMPKIYQHSGTHLFLLFWKAYHAVMRYDQASIRELGFRSLTDFAVLEVLLHKGPLPVNTIGEKVLLTSGSITTAVDRLARKSLVQREKSEYDRRVVLVHLTEAGRERITRAFAAHGDNLDVLFNIFDDEERAQFAKLSRKLGVHAEKMNG